MEDTFRHTVRASCNFLLKYTLLQKCLLYNHGYSVPGISLDWFIQNTKST